MKMSPTIRASYELLGVPPSASAQEMKRAYHALALLYHPDRNQSAEAPKEFLKITEAYELLTDSARVADLNRRYLKEKLFRPVIEGIEITFGSFFGYRMFDPMRGFAARSTSSLRLKGRTKTKGPVADEDFDWLPIEEDSSVLDNAAYDAIEVIYAGRLSAEDEQRLRGETQTRKITDLPWVVLNNQGILRFFESDLRGAKKCYQELCERIPNNILFTYRLGLCLILEGFKTPRRTLLGKKKPDRIKIARGIELLRHCLKLGAERPVGRQKCLVIRKTLADVLERMGNARQARAIWRDVFREAPSSAEAAFRANGRDQAIKILNKKKKKSESRLNASKQLRIGSSSPEK